MIKFYNTLSRKLEEFKTIDDNKVRLYSCGPTVYNYVHIGNLRAYIFVDLLKRFLKYSGYEVKHVMNITDVDDKTIKGCLKEKKSLTEFTDFYYQKFLKDLNSLNIQLPDAMPKATDYIDDMVGLVKSLESKGVTYQSEGSIYFKMRESENYGEIAQLDKQNLKENASGRLQKDEYEKDDANDFVLWKSWTSKDGDVCWDTELGRGRPGWHIECSAIAMKNLGETLDIHTGGVDLIFPHHTNEIAQSEKSTGKKFVNYWMHNEHLLVDGKKMSKSLNNFYTLRDIVEKGYDPLLLRLILLKTNYRQVLNFSFSDFEEARKIVLKFVNLLISLKLFKGDDENVNNFLNIDTLIEDYRNLFKEALNDDLNISVALSHSLALVKDINKNINSLVTSDIEKIRSFVYEIDKVFGFIEISYSKYVAELDKKLNDKNISNLLMKRESARKLKDYDQADRLRKELLESGLWVEDTKNGYTLKIE